MNNNDLISRSALLEEMERVTFNTSVEAQFPVQFAYEKLVGVAEAAPAVDAEPVRHGRWVNIQRPGSSLWCSECKSASPWAARHNYCPNCGAKMDAEVEGC